MTQTQAKYIEESEAAPVAVEVQGGKVWVTLDDGRVIGVPLEWYLPLANASPEELGNYELLDDSIYWPDLDEDLSIASMLAGVRPRYPWSNEAWRARANALRELRTRYGPGATLLTPVDMTDALDASVTVREIAEDYGLSTDAVYQAIRRKRLPAQRSGATWLIRRRDAEALWGLEQGDVSRVEGYIVTRPNVVAKGEDFVAGESWREAIMKVTFENSLFAISQAVIQEGALHITAQKRAGAELVVGNTLLIIDFKDGMPMGVFRVNEVRGMEYDAIEIGDTNPVWKGYVYQQGRDTLSPDVAAVLVR